MPFSYLNLESCHPCAGNKPYLMTCLISHDGRSTNPIDYLYQQIQPNIRPANSHEARPFGWILGTPNNRSNSDQSMEARNIFTMSNSVALKRFINLRKRENHLQKDRSMRRALILITPPRAGGAGRNRTDDLLLAKQALSQLSYGPIS